MALFGGEGTFNPFLGQGGVQGAAGNFAGMLPGAFAITPFAGKGEVDQTGGFLAGGGWAQPPGAGQYPPGFGLPAQLAGGPSLFPIPKDINKGEVKGKIGGVQGGNRNDLSKPYGGLQGMPQAMGPDVPGFSMGNMAPFQTAYIRDQLEGQKIPNQTQGGFLNWFTENMKT